MPLAVAIILNGISRKKKKFYDAIYPRLTKEFTPEVFETQRAGHAAELGRQTAERGFQFVIAAGGDGTLNQVVNGVMQSAKKTLPVLGLIPLGTGNDFARMCGLSADPESLIHLVHRNKPKSLDLGRVNCRNPQGAEVVRYFINACSVGMGPAVVKRLESSDRSWGPTLTYWKAITSTFFTHQPQEIHCRAKDWEWHGKIRVLVVANGQSFGNSLYIAPDALPDDGVLNTFIAGEIPLLKFLIYQQRLKSKQKIQDNRITYNKTICLDLTAPATCPIETEGELAGCLPARVEIVPSAIGFLR